MKLLIVCATSLSVLAVLPAAAGPLAQERQVVVHYGDINVKQPVGAKILLARIDAASHEVCGPSPDLRQIGQWQAYKVCAQTAADQAVASLPFDLMTALQGSLRETVASR